MENHKKSGVPRGKWEIMTLQHEGQCEIEQKCCGCDVDRMGGNKVTTIG